MDLTVHPTSEFIKVVKAQIFDACIFLLFIISMEMLSNLKNMWFLDLYVFCYVSIFSI